MGTRYPSSSAHTSQGCSGGAVIAWAVFSVPVLGGVSLSRLRILRSVVGAIVPVDHAQLGHRWRSYSPTAASVISPSFTHHLFSVSLWLKLSVDLVPFAQAAGSRRDLLLFVQITTAPAANRFAILVYQ